MTALCASIDMRLVGNGNGKEKEKDNGLCVRLFCQRADIVVAWITKLVHFVLIIQFYLV